MQIYPNYYYYYYFFKKKKITPGRGSPGVFLVFFF
jgi:hypothetical protein